MSDILLWLVYGDMIRLIIRVPDWLWFDRSPGESGGQLPESLMRQKCLLRQSMVVQPENDNSERAYDVWIART